MLRKKKHLESAAQPGADAQRWNSLLPPHVATGAGQKGNYDPRYDPAYRIFPDPADTSSSRPRNQALARHRPELSPEEMAAFEAAVNGKLAQHNRRQVKQQAHAAQRARLRRGIARTMARLAHLPEGWRLPQRYTRRQVMVGLGVTGAVAAGIATGVIAADASLRSALTSRRPFAFSPNVSGRPLAPPFIDDDQRIAHLLRRVGFGLIPGELETYRKQGLAQTTEQLINYAAIPEDMTGLEQALALNLSDAAQLAPWFLARMTYSKRPLQEKMTLFWHGLLTGSYRKLGYSNQMPLVIQQNETIRKYALGRFDDLIYAMTIDPIMLYWLDGHSSTGANPNENYARELMELFTMGIGNYTQKDVHYGALALTGWTVIGLKSSYIAKNHYDGVVTFLGHTGHLGVNDVVRLVCAHPATGKHLASHLWAFFVSDTFTDDDLKPLVDAYYHSNHSIEAVMRALLASPAFYDPHTYRARVKSPAEFVVSALRGMGVAPGKSELIAMARAMDGMGKSLFDPPNVAGWPGDKTSGAWVSTQAWMARANFINTLVNNITTSAPNPFGTAAGYASQGDAHDSFIQRIVTGARIRSGWDLVDYFSKALIDGYISIDRRAFLASTLKETPNTHSDSRFTQPLRLAEGPYLEAQSVREMLYLLLFSPDFLMN